MKVLSVFFFLVLLLFPLHAYAQSLSELDKQLDEANLERIKEIEEAKQQQIEREDELIKTQEQDSIQFNDEQDIYIVIGIVIVIIIVAIIFGASRKQEEPEIIPRQGWTEIEKEQVRIRQNGLCDKCKRPPPRWEYDHIDGNRDNNDLDNCKGLCPNCHAVKTYDED